MKNVLYFFGCLILVLACGPSQTTESAKLYGEAFEPDKTLKVSRANDFMSDTDSLMATFQGIIEQSCAAKGCWMTLRMPNGESLRVTFKDYGFFVPTEGLEGKQATFQGICYKKETSVDELRHYAMDAGKSEDEIAMITEPKREFAFVASGVLIKE